MLCSTCLGSGLKLTESGAGANLQSAALSNSRRDIASAQHSAPSGMTRRNKLPMLFTVIGRNCSIDFTTLMNLFGGISALLPMHLKMYQRTAERVRDVSTQAATDVMKEVAKSVRKGAGRGPGSTSPVKCTTSTLASPHKRDGERAGGTLQPTFQ